MVNGLVRGLDGGLLGGVVWGMRLKKGDENGNWMGIGGENMRGKGEGMFEGVLLAGNWIKNRVWKGI